MNFFYFVGPIAPIYLWIPFSARLGIDDCKRLSQKCFSVEINCHTVEKQPAENGYNLGHDHWRFGGNIWRLMETVELEHKISNASQSADGGTGAVARR